MKKFTLIYYDGGDDYKGTHEIDRKGREQYHQKARKLGHTGYLTGYRYWGNEKENVICYFTRKPSLTEIEKRRSNGFIRATWYWL